MLEQFYEVGKDPRWSMLEKRFSAISFSPRLHILTTCCASPASGNDRICYRRLILRSTKTRKAYEIQLRLISCTFVALTKGQDQESPISDDYNQLFSNAS